MLKKILAASTAGVLALTALASVAMADETDGADILIENTEKYITYELTAELTASQIEELIGNKGTNTSKNVVPEDTYKLNTTQDSSNSYSNIALSIWRDASMSGFDFKGGTIEFKLQGELQDQYIIKNGTPVQDNATASWTAVTPSDSDPVNVKTGAVAGSSAPNYAFVFDTSMIDDGKLSLTNGDISTPVGTKGGPAGFIYNTVTGELVSYTTDNPVKGTYDKNFEKEYTIASNVSWHNQTNAAASSTVSTPAVIKADFGLSGTTELQNIDFNDSKVKITISVGGTSTQWNGLFTTGSTGSFNYDANSWSSLMDLLNSPDGQSFIANKFGIAGESGNVTNGTFNHLAGLSTVLNFERGKTDEETRNVPLPMNASVPIGVGQNASIPTLQKMNNGGKMKFHFDKDLSSALIVGTVIFYGTSGQVALPVGSDYAWEDNGQTLVMDFPANLTYDPSMTNKYNSFKASYNLVCNTVGGVVTGDTIGNTNFTGSDQYGTNHLMKITFHANAEAPAGNGNGGLVDDNSKPADSTPTTSTPTNSGTQSGGEKNPGTGVAVAVAPVVLAAAGAAVVISKKRK
ncbi:MAG: NPXTG-anchored protein [Ruminococcaceae bacterium]|nr:NPXTG-anchored protein [Oscillospiraceae bacterium]